MMSCYVTLHKILRELYCFNITTKQFYVTDINSNLPPGLLKDAACNLSAPLAHLINLSLQTGTFPADWKVAKVVPVHKSGSFSSFDNYRSISILPILSKIIEKAVHWQVKRFLEVNKFLSKFQFGFRPKLSTKLAATPLFDEIRQHVDEGKVVGAT